MRLFLNFCLLSALTFPVFGDIVGFYSGDFDPSNPDSNALANETNALVSGSPTGASTYQSFVVPTGGWTVTRLFSNNLIDFGATSAYWEIRSGVSAGDGGTLLHSGTDLAPTISATGRTALGYDEATVSVSGLSIFLAPGAYWMTVTPQDATASGRSFQTNTFGLNAIGTVPQNVAYLNSTFFGANFENANGFGVFPAFSGGVYIDAVTGVPEPVDFSIVLLGSAGLAGLVRRRRR